MRTKIVLALAAAFGLGFLTQRYLPPEWDTGRHWRAVRRYMAYVRDPRNAVPDPSGLSYITPPKDEPGPHLAALVAAGELEYLDVVFPNVLQSNREATQHGMAFCDRHQEKIVYAEGGPYVTPSYRFRTRGEPLQHLQLWYKNSAEDLVLQLIREIDEFGAKR
jgi:hypothetical protein